MKIVTTRAEAGDFDRLIALMAILYAEEGYPFAEDTTRLAVLVRLLGDGSLGAVWAFREGDEIVGYLVGTGVKPGVPWARCVCGRAVRAAGAPRRGFGVRKRFAVAEDFAGASASPPSILRANGRTRGPRRFTARRMEGALAPSHDRMAGLLP
jgi:hypothetical protein